MTNHSVKLNGDKVVAIAVDEYGSGKPFLMLHGGAGPQSVARFAQLLAGQGAHVVVSTHPGFSGTPRPDWLNSVRVLAESYVALIEQLGLSDVTVIGNSIGGWIASEIALLHSARISQFVLIDAVGIVVEGEPVADIFPLAMDEVAQLSYYTPAAFRIDVTALNDDQKRMMAANRQNLRVYTNDGTMVDSTLRDRLSNIKTPTLMLWGDSDRIVTPTYGRAFAAAIPNATFKLLEKTGHLPHLETPDQVLAAIGNFLGAPSGIRSDVG